MAIADRAGLPVAAYISSSSPAEVTLVDATLDSGFLDVKPEVPIGDKLYDSGPHDEHLRTADRSVAIGLGGRSNDSSPDFGASDASRPDGNRMPRTSSASCSSVAFASCCDIHEMCPIANAAFDHFLLTEEIRIGTRFVHNGWHLSGSAHCGGYAGVVT